ncbi:hypothetical protein B0H14DRAFT_2302059, partial [Mycena olivaceomarginata]
GMSQYLTAVQGMPKDIEEYLDKRIKNFVWAGKRTAPINHDILFLPVNEGGQDLLSIKNRNEAIELMTLRNLLTSDGGDQAKWCSLARHRLRSEVPESGTEVDPKIRDSPFTQTWKPLQKNLPRPLKKMLVAARTFCLTLDTLALSKDLKEELPIFFHVGLKKGRTKHNNSECARCLRDNHNMRT